MGLFATGVMTRPQPLATLRDEVHRFTGVIDRFGSFLQNGATIRTLCLRDLRLASSQQPLDPDHWWFPHREIWSQAGIRSGDTVLFTAKVQRCTKGWHDPRSTCSANPRRQVLGFSATPRSVVVVRRLDDDRQQLAALETALALCQRHLSEAIRDHQQLAGHYATLLARHQALQALTFGQSHGRFTVNLTAARAWGCSARCDRHDPSCSPRQPAH
mgnify:CR=1 FL=1|jgi:hypothetical protein